MGTAILRGISVSLLVTVLTLLGGMLWTAIGFGGVSVSSLVDIGLLLSCLVGGFRTGKESGVWLFGGITGAIYVAVGAMLLALFLPLRSLGVLQVMLEGGLAGLIAGAIGAGGTKKVRGLGFAPGRLGRPHYSFNESSRDDNWSSEDWLKKEDWIDNNNFDPNDEEDVPETAPNQWNSRRSSGDSKDKFDRRPATEALRYNYESVRQPWWEEDMRKGQ